MVLWFDKFWIKLCSFGKCIKIRIWFGACRCCIHGIIDRERWSLLTNGFVEWSRFLFESAPSWLVETVGSEIKLFALKTLLADWCLLPLCLSWKRNPSMENTQVISTTSVYSLRSHSIKGTYFCSISTRTPWEFLLSFFSMRIHLMQHNIRNNINNNNPNIYENHKIIQWWKSCWIIRHGISFVRCYCHTNWQSDEERKLERKRWNICAQLQLSTTMVVLHVLPVKEILKHNFGWRNPCWRWHHDRWMTHRNPSGWKEEEEIFYFYY